MKVLDIIVTLLLVIGAINLGVVGLFGFNVVSTLFGEATALTRVIYTIIGVGGVYEALSLSVGYESLHNRWCEVPTTSRH